MLSKSQVIHVLIPGAQGLLQEGSEGLCCGVWYVPSRREAPAHMGADLRRGLAAGGDINTGFWRRASMSPGRGVWKGTEAMVGPQHFSGRDSKHPWVLRWGHLHKSTCRARCLRKKGPAPPKVSPTSHGLKLLGRTQPPRMEEAAGFGRP